MKLAGPTLLATFPVRRTVTFHDVKCSNESLAILGLRVDFTLDDLSARLGDDWVAVRITPDTWQTNNQHARQHMATNRTTFATLVVDTHSGKV